jgi:signal transduction histidine kinase
MDLDHPQPSKTYVLSPFGLGLIATYAVLFAVLHSLARAWGITIYSLWYPIAGVRFAFLWRYGEKFAWPFALAELLVQALWGRFDKPPLEALVFGLSVVLPPLGYGLGIRLVRAVRQEKPERETALSMAIAMAVAPAVAASFSLPWAFLDQRAALIAHVVDRLAAILTFLIGDVLGVLLLAPPLLWGLAFRGLKSRHAPKRLTPSRVFEGLAAVVLAFVTSWVAHSAELGVRLEPFVLATVWVGLRLGPWAAWSVAASTALYVLFGLPAATTAVDRVELHLLAACIAVAGYLAGGYSDAEVRHAAEIAQRDRLLFQAERLKTLRAMSVAVIHEISQPLSTLAVEAKHLREASQAGTIGDEELKFTAQLIERKSRSLAELVRTLRRFGARTGDVATLVALSDVVSEAVAVVRAEAKALKVKLEVEGVSREQIVGNGLELQQALVNLLRNAMAASPGGRVLVRLGGTPARTSFTVENTPTAAAADGMGVGLIIARTIVEASSGELKRAESNGRVTYTADFPVKAFAHD